jgi:hypothetical protein
MREHITRGKIMIEDDYSCVGTCVTAFLDGQCIVAELPWRDEEDFSIADANASELGEEEFYAIVDPDPHVEAEIDGHEVEFLQVDGVYMIYDIDTNKHYFFV